MTKEQVEQKARDYFQSGFFCAESVARAIMDSHAEEVCETVLPTVSGFCGGLGGTREEACGALYGGVAMLGHLFGRMDPGDDMRTIFGMASELRTRFIDKFGATTCKVVLEKLGEQENFSKCKELTATTAGLLHDIVMESRTQSFASKCQCSHAPGPQ